MNTHQVIQSRLPSVPLPVPGLQAHKVLEPRAGGLNLDVQEVHVNTYVRLSLAAVSVCNLTVDDTAVTTLPATTVKDGMLSALAERARRDTS